MDPSSRTRDWLPSVLILKGSMYSHHSCIFHMATIVTVNPRTQALPSICGLASIWGFMVSITKLITSNQHTS